MKINKQINKIIRPYHMRLLLNHTCLSLTCTVFLHHRSAASTFRSVTASYLIYFLFFLILRQRLFLRLLLMSIFLLRHPYLLDVLKASWMEELFGHIIMKTFAHLVSFDRTLGKKQIYVLVEELIC